jgi:hypothetical protein
VQMTGLGFSESSAELLLDNPDTNSRSKPVDLLMVLLTRMAALLY